MSKQDTTTGRRTTSPEDMGWYYLHVNGELIYKPYSSVYDPRIDFEESSFVLCYWLINLSDREDAYNLLVRAKMLGAKKDRIEELVSKWNIDDDDTKVYCEKYGIKWARSGEQFIASAGPPIGDDGPVRGVGITLFKAVCDFYAKAVNLPEEDFKIWEGNKEG